MNLGILSDTHDQFTRCEHAVKLLQTAGAEAIVHCGDIIEPSIITICAALPCYFVLGNNDADNYPHLKKVAREVGAVFLDLGGVVTLGGKRVAITHGHLTSEVRKLMAMHPDYLLSGHTHMAEDRMVDGTRRINPGALHRARNFTVAVLDLDLEELTSIGVPR